jgi:hypothetical protein
MALMGSNMKLSSRKMKLPIDMADLDIPEYGNEAGLEHSSSKFSLKRRSPDAGHHISQSIRKLKRLNSGGRYTSKK